MAKGWQALCDDFRIDHKAGSSRKNIEVNCPLCFDDPSKHMGLSLESPIFGCWRNSTHKGGSFGSVKRLIMVLLQVPAEKAQAITESYFSLDDWMNDHSYEAPKNTAKFVQKPQEFHPITFENPEEGLFIQYLNSLGFDVKQIVNRYNLHYCNFGPYANRIIIPVIIRGNWHSWTARSIDQAIKPKYKAAGNFDEVMSPTEFLLDHHNLSGGKLLVVQEGSFDAMRVMSCLIPGVHSTAIFGQKISAAQISSLIELSPFYKKILIGADPKAEKNTMNTVERLGFYMNNCSYLPPQQNLDRGARTTESVREELKSYLANL